jgi:hypothetical protein
MCPRASEWPPYPPPNETAEEAAVRAEEEEAAGKISKAIDESINAEKEKRKNGPRAKLLLLGEYRSASPLASPQPLTATKHTGQAESGKSTILKNFQLRFAPQAFQQEVCPNAVSCRRSLTCPPGPSLASCHPSQPPPVHSQYSGNPQ